MKYITESIKNIKNLLPYLLLIAIYFFFVNLEARKDNETNRTNENEAKLIEEKSSEQNKQQRIKIPVIPYKQ
jgi:Na+/H+ antiporter NhaC